MKIKYLQEGDEWDKTKKVTTAIGSLLDRIKNGVEAGVEAAKKRKNLFDRFEKHSLEAMLEYQRRQDKLRQDKLSQQMPAPVQAQIPSLATPPFRQRQPQHNYNTYQNNMSRTQYYQQGGQMGSQQEVQKFCAEMIEAGIIDEKGLQQLAQKQPETIQQLFAIWKQSGIDGVIQAIQETQKARYGAKLNRLKQLRKVK